MTAETDLESRLRTGLRAAGEALPPVEPADPARPGRWSERPGGPHLHRRRRAWVAGAAAAAVVAAAVGVGVASLGGDDGPDAPDLEVSQTPTTGPSTTATTVPDAGPGVDPAAGSAVVVGTDLVSLGPDGQPGDTLPLAPLTDVQSVVSDRHGGWIACGTPAQAPIESPPVSEGATTTTGIDLPSETAFEARDPNSPGTMPSLPDVEPQPRTPNTYRFRAGQDPEPLSVDVLCVADSLGVTEVGGHDALVHVSPATFSLNRLDLATGDVTPLAIDLSSGPRSAGVGGGRLAMVTDAGLGLWDLATGEPLAVAPIDLPVRAADATSGPLTSDLALSPDGATLAAVVGDPSAGTAEVVVADLATGTELFRTTVAASVEGGQLAYDGTTVAVGNFYESNGPVHVYDLATGAERTVDVHGLLP